MIYKNLSLSAYAYGYGFKFINDKRVDSSSFQSMTLEKLNKIAKKYNLGGVEIPIDHFFLTSNKINFFDYNSNLKKINLKLIYALENFSHKSLKRITPFIENNNVDFIRVKVSNFYGGNRYKNVKYKSDLNKIRIEVLKSLKLLKDYKIKILIENHQDITLKDIFNLIDEFGQDVIGINWDTGNSFPTGETINSFLEKSINFIGNVHLKDYKIQLSKNGYIMHRCSLGSGVVDFKFLLKKLITNNKNIPLTIELGAFNSREAFINNKNYWTHTDGVSEKQKENLINFIKLNSESEDKNLSTLWERKESPSKIATNEKKEVESSIIYILKQLNKLYEF